MGAFFSLKNMHTIFFTFIRKRTGLAASTTKCVKMFHNIPFFLRMERVLSGRFFCIRGTLFP